MGRRLTLLGLGLGLLTSCGSTGSTSNGASPGDAGGGGTLADSGSPHPGTPLPCAVERVIASQCRTCHASPPLFGAPMPLVTLEDLHAPSHSDPSVAVLDRVHARIHDDARPMPPPPNARLDTASSSVLDAWIASGGTANGASCTTPPPADAGPGGTTDPPECTPDVHLAPTTPFVMTSSETYACYGFDVPVTSKRHITQIKMRVDNAHIIHHALLLASPASTSGTPLPCSAAPSLSAPMLYAWAPGGAPLVLPADAGFPQEGTAHYVVQIHYNNAANVPNPSDSSGFDMCTTDNLRKYDADVIAFGSEAIIIPPAATADVTSCLTAPAAYDGRHVFAAFPHMHQLGKSITTNLLPGGTGTPVDMGTDAAWDFSNQPWLPVDATIHTGDVIKTHCKWNNPGGGFVTFGQSTTDEMCYSFSAYYPKLDVASGWAAPATASSPCQ